MRRVPGPFFFFFFFFFALLEDSSVTDSCVTPHLQPCDKCALRVDVSVTLQTANSPALDLLSDPFHLSSKDCA